MGARRVKNRRPPGDYDAYERQRLTADKKRNTGKKVKRSAAKKHHNKQKKRRRLMARVRAAVILVLTVTVICAVTLLTPLFDIKYVTVTGNSYVSNEEIQSLSGGIIGENLVTVRKKEIKKTLKTNKYINEVQVKKKLFPPTVALNISEYIPLCYLQSGNKLITLDKNLYVIDETDADSAQTLTCVTGVKSSSAETGEVLKTEDEDIAAALKVFLEVMGEDDMIHSVVSLDLADIGNITFNYDNRITALCGSSADLEKKLRLFKTSVTDASMKSDARGTMDLTVVGNAVYTP